MTNEKQRSFTVRVDDQTETKFGLIWNELQSREPPQIRLSRSDVFNIIIRDYYQHVTGVRHTPFLRVHESKRELE